MFHLLKGKASAVFGTHTHVGTDDLQIDEGTCFVSDVGLSGARDGVIGMDKTAPLKRFLTGLPVPWNCPKMQENFSNGDCEDRRRKMHRRV